jgi:hypothetical protein
MACAICGAEGVGGDGSYPNLVCDDCDERAVGADGDTPWTGWPPGEAPEMDDDRVHMPPDHGENPVFIDGRKCWRRYRFGGWVTMLDEHDCASLEEFYETHGLM